MFPNLPRKFLITIILIFILLNTGLFYLLNFSLPQNVEVTDITANSAAIVWNTKAKEASQLLYSSNPVFIKLLPLTVGFVQRENEAQKSVNHRLVLSGLKPGQKYYLAIVSGIHFYKSQKVKSVGLNNRLLKITESSIPIIKTLSSVILGRIRQLAETTPESDLSAEASAKADSGQARMTNVTGLVTTNNLQLIPNALVIIKTASNQVFSVLTDNQGGFSLKVPETTDNLIFITALNGTTSQKMIAVSKNLIKQPILMRLP